MKKLTFLFTEKESNNEIFLAEALKLAVIHTACTKTVVGEDWYNDYINDLSKSDKEKLQIPKSSTSFKFGDGHKVWSFKKVKIPASIGANKIEEILILENDSTLPEKTSQITKIHKQFRHATIANMKKLLKNANSLNNEINKIIEDVVYACDTCTPLKTPLPHPVVGLPKSSEFNDVVSVDLHYIKQDLY